MGCIGTTPPDCLEEKIRAPNRAKSPPLCSQPWADYPAPLQGCRGELRIQQHNREVKRRAERHTLKGYKAKLILTDGGYLNIYNLGVGVHVFQLQK